MRAQTAKFDLQECKVAVKMSAKNPLGLTTEEKTLMNHKNTRRRRPVRSLEDSETSYDFVSLKEK